MIKNETNGKYYIRIMGKTHRDFRGKDGIWTANFYPLDVPVCKNNPVYVECTKKCLALLEGFLLRMTPYNDAEWCGLHLKCRQLIGDDTVKNGSFEDLYAIKELLAALDYFEYLFKDECSMAYPVERIDDDILRKTQEEKNWALHHNEYYLDIHVVCASTIKEAEEKYIKKYNR